MSDGGGCGRRQSPKVEMGGHGAVDSVGGRIDGGWAGRRVVDGRPALEVEDDRLAIVTPNCTVCRGSPHGRTSWLEVDK